MTWCLYLMTKYDSWSRNVSLCSDSLGSLNLLWIQEVMEFTRFKWLTLSRADIKSNKAFFKFRLTSVICPVEFNIVVTLGSTSWWNFSKFIYMFWLWYILPNPINSNSPPTTISLFFRLICVICPLNFNIIIILGSISWWNLSMLTNY